jgi:hypothetical protein
MIAALAGRRVDAEDSSEPRFPLESAPLVTARIRSRFQELAISTLVCSAARGADLLALEAAGALGLRRCIVLPTDVASFRASSVVDGLAGEGQKGYGWGAIFDRILATVDQQGDLSILPGEASGQSSYLAVNTGILEQAARLAASEGDELRAILVWNLESRGPDDVTAAFRDQAVDRGVRVEEISTL